jgi:hypothetical protein
MIRRIHAPKSGLIPDALCEPQRHRGHKEVLDLSRHCERSEAIQAQIFALKPEFIIRINFALMASQGNARPFP